MNKLDQLIQSIDRLVELNEEILSEIRGSGLTEPSNSNKLKKLKLTPEILDRLINSKQVRAKLKISESTLSRHVQSGLITPIPIGKQHWFDIDQIDALRNYFLK